jgi:hypothetical protein
MEHAIWKNVVLFIMKSYGVLNVGDESWKRCPQPWIIVVFVCVQGFLLIYVNFWNTNLLVQNSCNKDLMFTF